MKKPIHYKSPEEIDAMRESAHILSGVFGLISEQIQVGVTGLALDKIAEAYIRAKGGTPAFLGLYDFPATLCVSVNDAVVHGIPDKRPFKAGDLVSIDCGVSKNGWCADQAYTFGMEPLAPKHRRLLQTTRLCLEKGIQACRAGQRIGDIGAAVQAQANGYGVVTELVGHGIGRAMHEGPDVPNYGKRGQGTQLKAGMTLAIEPMINHGRRHIRHDKDGWTIRTADGAYSAHFEHTVALMDGRTEVLTTTQWIKSDQALLEEATRAMGRAPA